MKMNKGVKISRVPLENKSSNELIESTLRDLKKLKKVVAVILFGSYARMEQKPISDIDICIVTYKDISDKIKAEISGYGSKKVDITLFWDLPPTVRYAALKEGKILFCRDEEIMHIATSETMSEYLDFKRIINRHCDAILGAENG